jgi:hypothetical protein
MEKGKQYVTFFTELGVDFYKSMTVADVSDIFIVMSCRTVVSRRNFSVASAGGGKYGRVEELTPDNIKKMTDIDRREKKRELVRSIKNLPLQSISLERIETLFAEISQLCGDGRGKSLDN